MAERKDEDVSTNIVQGCFFQTKETFAFGKKF